MVDSILAMFGVPVNVPGTLSGTLSGALSKHRQEHHRNVVAMLWQCGGTLPTSFDQRSREYWQAHCQEHCQG